jgi:hypothetical protein
MTAKKELFSRTPQQRRNWRSHFSYSNVGFHFGFHRFGYTSHWMLDKITAT